MIPKIMHQIWLGTENKQPEIMMKSWIDKNPSWEYKLWTEENLPTLINQKQFDDVIKLNAKSNILRYELLYQFGGYYIDADSECIRPLEDFLTENDSFAAYENEKVRPGLIATGNMGATKGNKLMKLLIDGISKMDEMNKLASWKLLGPRYLTNTINNNKYTDINIYPSYYFMPEHYTGEKYTGDDIVFAKQFWGSTLGYKNLK